MTQAQSQPPAPETLQECPPALRRKPARRRAVTFWLGGLAVLAILAVLMAFAALPPAVWWGYLALALVWAIAGDRLMRRAGGIPCLCWHSVSRSSAWLPWADHIAVTPETLDRQLALLSRMGLQPIDTVEFCRRRAEGEPVPDNAVMLHFDDGYLDNWVAAAPLLKKHAMRATMFVSLDFIAPDRPLPDSLEETDTPPQWDGYLSWREIAALDQGAFGGVFDIQAHGVDHARVPTGPEVATRLTRGNWRKLAWVQWRQMPGDKHDWYLADTPPCVPLGSDVPVSEGALAARAWHPETGLETQDAYEARVRADLVACRDAFRDKLGKAPAIFCWPQNRTSPDARRIARQEGYLATTGGLGSNRTTEDPAIVSRVHVGERVAGFANAFLDDLAFRATVRSFQGNQYWYLCILAIHAIGRLARLWPRRSAAPAQREALE